MKKLLSLLLITVMVLSMALAGCSNNNEETTTKAPEQTTKAPGGETTTKAPEPAKEPATLRLANSTEPQAIDQHRYFTGIDRTVTLSIYEPLLREFQGETVPAAAESWTVSEDGLVYTFKLREGMKWTDGEPLVAQHYVDGIKRLGDPNLASSMGGTYTAMFKNGPEYNQGLCSFDEVGVKALDELTVEYTLGYPVAYFLDQIKSAAYLPIRIEIPTQMGETFGGSTDNLVYCGPYIVKEWIREAEMTLVKNESYWAADTLAQIETVHYDFVASNETRALMFDNDDIDYNLLGTAQVEVYKDSPYFNVFVAGNGYGFLFNTNNEQLNNLNLRKALSFAPDRKGICEGLFFGAYTPSTRLIPDGTLSGGTFDFVKTNPDNKGWEVTPQVELAQDCFNKALTELNMTKEQIDLAIMTGDADSTRLTAEASIDAFEQVLGIIVDADLYPSQQRWDNEVNGRYLIDITGYSTSINDPWEYLNGYIEDGGNYLHTGIMQQELYPQFEAKMKEAQREADPEKYTKLMGEAEKLMMDTYVHSVLYFGNRIYTMRTDRFEGVEQNRSGADLNFIFAKAIA